MRMNAWKTLLLAGSVCVAMGASAMAADCGPLKSSDADANGKLEKAEAKKAAADAWRKVVATPNKAAEFEARLGAKELAEGTAGGGVTEKEYVEIASSLFSAADGDKEGSIDCAELESPEGKALLKLLK
jgi:hypothetical protein